MDRVKLKKKRAEAKFLVPDWDIVEGGICSLADRYDNSMPPLTIYPNSGTRNLATVRNLQRKFADGCICNSKPRVQ